MGLRGPQPKATKIRALEGNPAKRRLNDKEPTPEGAAIKPAHIVGAAAAEWDRVILSMPPGFYTAADVTVLEVYVLSWVTYRNALGVVAREGMTIKGSMGQLAAHPAQAIAAQQAQLILKAADRLGLSPAARARLEIKGEEKVNKFDGLLGGRSRAVN